MLVLTKQSNPLLICWSHNQWQSVGGPKMQSNESNNNNQKILWGVLNAYPCVEFLFRFICCWCCCCYLECLCVPLNLNKYTHTISATNSIVSEKFDVLCILSVFFAHASVSNRQRMTDYGYRCVSVYAKHDQQHANHPFKHIWKRQYRHT